MPYFEDGPFELDHDPSFCQEVGVLIVDPHVSEDIVLVANPRILSDPLDPDDDQPILESLEEIIEIWPDKTPVLWEWMPDPVRWPAACEFLLDNGFTQAIFRPETVDKLDQAGLWDDGD